MWGGVGSGSVHRLVSGHATLLLHGAGIEVLPIVLVRPLTRATARRLAGRPLRLRHGKSEEEAGGEGSDDAAAGGDDAVGDEETDLDAGGGEDGDIDAVQDPDGEALAWDPR